MAESAKKKPKDEQDRAAVLEKIEAWDAPYSGYGMRIHELIEEHVPALKAKLFYGMPGYHTGGPILCFFRVDGDLMTFGITEKANLTREKGAAHQLMPSAWFFRELDKATEERIVEIAAGQQSKTT